ncbi:MULTISPECIES: response regulator [unclassified Sorangium]|uniref:Two-component response regulator n=1 Tax=Sorangium cellulosum TaxID=56 RepID=A0A150SN91_SORCE|nr:two-component response regulator [Sorangium cellulosum]KYF98172.1 two-component response regulator [Sorangium cellulosum]
MNPEQLRERAWSPSVPPEPLPSVHPVATPVRVLLAEDDRELRLLLATALRRDGYEVLEARDANHLLELMGDALVSGGGAPADVVVSDIRMPGRSGLELLAGLRRDDWATPVVLITAFGDPETHAEAYRLGADAVLDKPLDVDDLRVVVQTLASMRG